MEDTSKYLIHAEVVADGVVERSDVVGAIFGQTEGLLGAELDLRDLRRSGKVGRIDVELAATKGTSHGTLTIATNLDKVETATLAASLETISRVGPCRATIEITELEDVRAAKRKAVVDRATELLRTGFDDSVMSSEEILAEVRKHVRVEDVTEYEGLPAGPRVEDGDAIIVVEGRSDVLTLLKYGVKNAIAVEGTNVPEAVADLTNERTVTAFLDGDRGGDLILEELTQVGDVDYVAFAPAGRSVEDLDHHELFSALRKKVPYDAVAGVNVPREAVAATDGSATPAPPAAEDAVSGETAPDSAAVADLDAPAETEVEPDVSEPDEAASDDGAETIYGHVEAVVRRGSEAVRFLDADRASIEETDAGDALDALESLPEPPWAIVLDDVAEQRLVDVAADRGVEVIVARSLGQFTKRPASVRVYAAEEVAERPPEGGS